jgi:hypothetical protein
MAKKVGLVVVAAVALAAPTTAGAAKGGNPPIDSCGLGKPGTQELRADPTRPGASEIRDYPPNLCRGNGPVAAAAQAGTIRLGPYREVADRRSENDHDADNSGGRSPGDFFTGRLFLVKGKRRAGVVQFKSTIVTMNGTAVHLRDEYTATIRRQGRQRGGTLKGVYEHDEDFNQRPKVGDADRIPVTSGTGRFQGYTGEIVSRIVRVAPNGEPFFRDTIVLRKQP